MLRRPTIEYVTEECKEFDLEPSTQLGENALSQLQDCFPQNVDPAHVILKAIALNRLYSARVQDQHVEMIAREIAKRGIDPLLAVGSANAIDQIVECCNERRYFSFATKFCSWHNPKAYVIYDGNVDECLWRYKRQDQFSRFWRYELEDYGRLAEIIADFQTYYQLGDVSVRDIDKFLWRVGDKLLNAGAGG
jgi:hypothetical protein